MHIVLRVDTTNATADDRLRMYVNGSQVTDFGTRTNPPLNADTDWNNTGEHRIGKLVGASQFLDGYLAEINHVDGSSLAPTEFGETDADTGQWVPIEYTGSYGTNGFYIDGADSSFLGKDAKATSAAVTNKASTSSEWGGSTGAYTFATNEIDRSSTVNAIISTDLLSGDFSFDFTMTTSGGALRVGVIDDQDFNTFNGTGDDGGMDSMTNSWYLDKGNNQFRYGGASQGSASGVANGSAVTIERTGSTIKITDDGSDAHTFSQTFSGPVRVVISGGGAAFNLDNVQYTADGASGNDNSFFSSGLAAADQVTDSPTDNFATWNPIIPLSNGSFADGNLEFTQSGGTISQHAKSTISFTSGEKKVCEMQTVSGSSITLGICDEVFEADNNGFTGDSRGYFDTNGNKVDSAGNSSSYGASFGTSNVIRIEVDLSSNPGTIEFFKDGVSQGDAFTDIVLPRLGSFGAVARQMQSKQTLDSLVLQVRQRQGSAH